MAHQFDIGEIRIIINDVRLQAKNAGYDYPPVNAVCDEIIRQLEMLDSIMSDQQKRVPKE